MINGSLAKSYAERFCQEFKPNLAERESVIEILEMSE